MILQDRLTTREVVPTGGTTGNRVTPSGRELLEELSLRLHDLREIELVVWMPLHETPPSNVENVLTIGLSETS